MLDSSTKPNALSRSPLWLLLLLLILVGFVLLRGCTTNELAAQKEKIAAYTAKQESELKAFRMAAEAEAKKSAEMAQEEAEARMAADEELARLKSHLADAEDRAESLQQQVNLLKKEYESAKAATVEANNRAEQAEQAAQEAEAKVRASEESCQSETT